MAMSMEAEGSMAGVPTTLTARLDGLRVDQSPDDLSNALRSAFTEPELYKIYISSLAVDQARAKLLLEVFDKVNSQNSDCSVKLFSASLYETGPDSPSTRCKTF
jgi:hypothetical protein